MEKSIAGGVREALWLWGEAVTATAATGVRVATRGDGDRRRRRANGMRAGGDDGTTRRRRTGELGEMRGLTLGGTGRVFPVVWDRAPIRVPFPLAAGPARTVCHVTDS